MARADSILLTANPCGGVVIIRLSSDADGSTWRLSRAIGSVVTDIPAQDVNGNPYLVFLDDGFGLGAQLPSGREIVYTFNTANGSSTASILLANTVFIDSGSLTKTLLSALQAGCAALQTPTGQTYQNRPSVREAMPLNSTVPLPLISLEEVLCQQEYRKLGADSQALAQGNSFDLAELAQWRYHVSILAMTMEERQFWKNAVLAILKTTFATIGPVIGQDTVVSYQVQSGQVEDPKPGFYYADVGFNVTGPLTHSIRFDYGIVEEFDVTVQGSTGSSDYFTVTDAVAPPPPPPLIDGAIIARNGSYIITRSGIVLGYRGG